LELTAHTCAAAGVSDAPKGRIASAAVTSPARPRRAGGAPRAGRGAHGSTATQPFLCA
jgi:hypothetical protein